MKSKRVAILIYGDINSGRDALVEEKYKDLAASFLSHGFDVQSVLYNDGIADQISTDLLQFDAVLVWVNPIEQGKDRTRLDLVLTEIFQKGCFVSTHPETIIKMGTKEVLYKTRDMEWGSDIKLYSTYEDFVTRFPISLHESGVRILKQYRGNGGNGVYKVVFRAPDVVILIHAIAGDVERTLPLSEFNSMFKSFFSNNGMLIDQEWNANTINGMVRCYLSGSKVAGFGYQEINALYELDNSIVKTYFPPSKRYYFTENCGLFSDLKEVMETRWVPQLKDKLSITEHMMPVLWDADFFINGIGNTPVIGKYTLCEINVSSVSPFPPSAIKFIVNEAGNRIGN